MIFLGVLVLFLGCLIFCSWRVYRNYRWLSDSGELVVLIGVGVRGRGGLYFCSRGGFLVFK